MAAQELRPSAGNFCKFSIASLFSINSNAFNQLDHQIILCSNVFKSSDEVSPSVYSFSINIQSTAMLSPSFL